MSAPATDERLIAARADFPILATDVRPGVPLVYLDNAATTQKPASVMAAMDDYYEHLNSNVHRGVHTFSEKATAAYEGARRKVRDFIHAASSHEIVFVRNATEAINLVAHAWGRANLKPGDEILVSEMEHHANIVPWQLVAAYTGAVVKPVAITEQGRIDQDAYARALESGRVKLAAIAHVSNVLGTINPVADMARKAHDAGALVMVDAAQSIPHMPLDVQALGADFAAFSAHKMVGPTGIGVLYGKRALLDAMPPFLGGGSMIDTVSFEKTTFAAVPARFEAGTPAIAEAVGLAAAIDYLRGVGMETIHVHERALIGYAMEGLSTIPGLRMIGPPPGERAGLVAFALDSVHPHDLAQGLDAAGIAVRAGHHCAMPLHTRYGLGATVRASFYLYNTFEEADRLVETVEKTRAFFAR
ncbi:MAG: cysteine desulfurase [Anaerolineae bacterium]|nr:cysteine desulfurase [Anaerolineae bacterium]